MNLSDKLKRDIGIVEFLASRGFKSTKNNRNDYFYCSPIRGGEKTASFKVNSLKNVWYDHGIGEGGNILDLVMTLDSVDFNMALSILSSYSNIAPIQRPIAQERASEKEKSGEIEIIKVADITQNMALVDYMQSRAINIDLAALFVRAVYWENVKNDKTNFAIGFKNDSGGWEVRNKYYKGSLGNKDITLIKANNNTNNKLLIFEGFFDLISYATITNINIFKIDIVVLNSLAMLKRNIDIIRSYKLVYGYLDNDKAGNEATSWLYGELGNNFVDKRIKYQSYKDLNEYLQGNANVK